MAEAVIRQGESAFAWSGRSVDPAHIEAQLARLRYDAAGTPHDEEHLAPRTSLLTLVVRAQDTDSAREAAQTVASLPTHHPSRTIVVVPMSSAGESRIDAQLAAHCHITPTSDHRVCCEEVLLTVHGPASLHLHSVVVPLLIPDLPAYVWWNGPLDDDDHAIEELMENADRFIYDSSTIARPRQAMQRLGTLVADNRDCALGDLNWERLTNWRHSMLRQCEAPALIPFFGPIDLIELKTSPDPQGRPPVHAILMLGWLALKQGWDTARVIRDGPSRLSIVRDAPEAAVRLSVQDYSGVEHGSLVSFTVRGTRSGEHAWVTVHRGDDPEHLVLHVDSPAGAHEEHFRIPACDTGAMLARELDGPPRDREYQAVLRASLPFFAALGA